MVAVINADKVVLETDVTTYVPKFALPAPAKAESAVAPYNVFAGNTNKSPGTGVVANTLPAANVNVAEFPAATVVTFIVAKPVKALLFTPPVANKDPLVNVETNVLGGMFGFIVKEVFAPPLIL